MINPITHNRKFRGNMSNSRRWREFITWWNSVKKDIADEGTIKMIDERIRIICRNETR
jgi:hypothetical protein